jgi:hypothetical protein
MNNLFKKKKISYISLIELIFFFFYIFASDFHKQ